MLITCVHHGGERAIRSQRSARGSTKVSKKSNEVIQRLEWWLAEVGWRWVWPGS